MAPIVAIIIDLLPWKIEGILIFTHRKTIYKIIKYKIVFFKQNMNCCQFLKQSKRSPEVPLMHSKTNKKCI